MDDQKSIKDLSPEELNLEIKNANSKKLVGYVIAYRLLGLYKNIASTCMEELLNRRENGEDFNFEKLIEDEINSVPKPNSSVESLLQVAKIFG